MKCSIRKGAIICPLCGNPHRARDHHVKCKGAPHNASLTCTCPPKCINCIRAGKSGKGHTALFTSCPLRKLYKTANTRTGESSEEEGPVIPDAATWAASNNISETDFVSDPSHLAAYSAFVTNIMKGRIPIERTPSLPQ